MIEEKIFLFLDLIEDLMSDRFAKRISFTNRIASNLWIHCKLHEILLLERTPVLIKKMLFHDFLFIGCEVSFRHFAVPQGNIGLISRITIDWLNAAFTLDANSRIDGRKLHNGTRLGFLDSDGADLSLVLEEIHDFAALGTLPHIGICVIEHIRMEIFVICRAKGSLPSDLFVFEQKIDALH